MAGMWRGCKTKLCYRKTETLGDKDKRKENNAVVAAVCGTISVSNGSRLSIRVWVWVATEREPDWRSGLYVNPNCRFCYGSIDICLPV